ncbi:TetR/AcrR family transcriptional regulator [Streptomyces armeniacus]|uniref:TetR/AcrR family transcriptional regulator n=1 Tax=Streptomyces armeniacus TaxID=83291 RepID=A0A345XJS0_9ACTN|nr:TetR/AcrR family transcriptional regulator [Streptomyces armeniacus]AXK31886.1 TetR/AcrR family transcriptional regulator [Streptomyces armeniacus]
MAHPSRTGADTAEDRARILSAARTLFNERGVQAVGMDAIRTASGVPLKRLYRAFPAKDELVQAVLREADRTVREELTAYVDKHADSPRDRVLAVFDYLHDWFGQPGFRGCLFLNTVGELGTVSPRVTDLARVHKQAFRDHLGELAAAAGLPPERADQLSVLANGAMATAGVLGTPAPARQAREIAATLLDAS